VPKRSNPFQRLILLIQHQIARDAKVTESKMLLNRLTGRMVEVDIVVEGQVGGSPIVIGIECTGTGRRASVEWVDRMRGKHEHLPVDKTILVCRRGFTKEALLAAKANGMEALQTKDANARNWSKWIGDIKDLRIAKLHFVVEQVELGAPAGTVLAPFTPQSQVSWMEDAGGRTGSLDAVAQGILNNPMVVEPAFNEWIKREKDQKAEPVRFSVRWDCPPGTTIALQPNSPALPLVFIKASARVVGKGEKFAATLSQFRDQDVLHGETDIETDEGKGNLAVSMLAKDGKLAGGAALVSTKGQEPRLVKMHVAKDLSPPGN
jgi:hypothetical protein